jgi:hypothetical protein
MIIFSSDSHHAKNELWNLFAGWYHYRSINQRRRHREVYSSTPSNLSLHGHTTLNDDCSIIADLVKDRMTGTSYLWRLLLNIMMTIPACTPIQ